MTIAEMIQSHQPVRLMALDVGDVRIGVAVCDATFIAVTPLTVVRRRPNATALEQIVRLVSQEHIGGMIVGLPLTLRGEFSDQTRQVVAFITQLKDALAIPIEMSDERYTTAAAQRVLQERGVRRERWRAEIDAIAASIILQDFIDAHRPPSVATEHIYNG